MVRIGSFVVRLAAEAFRAKSAVPTGKGREGEREAEAKCGRETKDRARQSAA